MPDKNHRSVRVAALVAQDPEINSYQLKEFRMQLESSLETLGRRGRVVLRAGRIASAVWVSMVVLTFSMEAFGIPVLNKSPVVSFVWAATGTISMGLAFFFLLLHRLKYQFAVSRTRFDLQTTMIRELQQQVEQLREEIRRNKA